MRRGGGPVMMSSCSRRSCCGGCGMRVGGNNNQIPLHTNGGTTTRIGGFDVPAGAVAFDPNTNEFLDANGNRLNRNVVGGVNDGTVVDGVFNPTVNDSQTTDPNASTREVAAGTSRENIPDRATYDQFLNADKGFRNIVVLFTAKDSPDSTRLKAEVKNQFANSTNTAVYVIERETTADIENHPLHAEYRRRGLLGPNPPTVVVLAQSQGNWIISSAVQTSNTSRPSVATINSLINRTGDGRIRNATTTPAVASTSNNSSTSATASTPQLSPSSSTHSSSTSASQPSSTAREVASQETPLGQLPRAMFASLPGVRASVPTSPEQEKKVTVPPAQPPSSEPLVCTDPQKALCENAPAPALREESTRKPLVEAAISESRNSKETLLSGNPFSFRDYLRALQSKVETADIRGIVEQVRGDLNLNISRFARAEDQQPMKERINSVPVVSFSELVINNPTSSLMTSFIVFCGPEGLAFNAVNMVRSDFSDPRLNNRPIVAMCPAYLSSDTTASQVYNTLSHEFGHSIDSGIFRNRYTNLEACFTRNYPGFSPQILQETTADFWKWKNVALRSKRGTPEAALAAAREASWVFCKGNGRSTLKFPPVVQPTLDALRAKPVHPSGDFRIIAFGRDPEMREAFGCKEKPKAGEKELCDI